MDRGKRPQNNIHRQKKEWTEKEKAEKSVDRENRAQGNGSKKG